MKTNTVSLLLVALFAGFACLQPAHAVVPPPDGGYPGFNTAEGQNALFSLSSGAANTAIGWFSLFSDSTASFNTAVGAGTLLFNTADSNTAVGTAALLLNTSGSNNTAVGVAALLNNNASSNTAIGQDALHDNTTGTQNTAVGQQALELNTVADNNTAFGFRALSHNISGVANTAVGTGSLLNSTGSSNIALGVLAGENVTTADNVICIGANVAGADTSNTCFVGNIYDTVQPIVGTDPDSVTITSNGRLGRGNVSSRRYKHDIEPMGKASEVLYSLKPVSFRYNKEYDATNTLAFGLIAEEVAEVYPDLVGRNREGQPESVRYEQINAMLLNEFLKEHRKNQEQEATIAHQQKQIETLTAGLQKVSAQLEVSKSAPQTVLHSH